LLPNDGPTSLPTTTKPLPEKLKSKIFEMIGLNSYAGFYSSFIAAFGSRKILPSFPSLQ